MEDVTKLKDQGNTAIAEGKYDEAIDCYTKALAFNVTELAHVLLTNRSLGYFHKKEWEPSLKDAKQAVVLQPTWVKGHVRAAKVLVELGRLKEACLAYDEALKLSSDSQEIAKATHLCHAKYIETFFAPLLRGKEVNVRYINRNKGRGVFAKRKFLKGEIVYFETPLVSHRNVEPERDEINSCSYTLKSIIPMDVLKFPWQEVMKERKGLPREFVPCPHCGEAGLYGEKYINQMALEKAWGEYHQILCVGAKGKDHAVATLIDKAREIKRTNPLFILRILATIVQRMRDIMQKDPTKPREQVIAEAEEPFSMFIANEEKGPLEQETVDTLNSLTGEEFTDVVTVAKYRTFNGAILRNAQDLNPLSELLVAINSLGPQSRAGAIELYNKDYKEQEDLMKDEWFQSLCFHASGLFLIGNSTNHSCDPNVVSTSSTNNFTVTMVALRDIAKDEELCISYIDQTKFYDERQKILKEMYLFDCKCEKCVYRW